MPAGSKRRDPRHRPQDDRLEILLLKQISNDIKRLHQEHLLILERLDSIDDTVSPELEAQVIRVSALATSIDRKVPDLQQPNTS